MCCGCGPRKGKKTKKKRKRKRNSDTRAVVRNVGIRLDVLFDRVFIQTGVVMTFQSTISGGFSPAARPPWVVRLEMLFLARTLAIPNC